MTRLHGLVELVVLVGDRASLERLGRDAHAGRKRRALSVVVFAIAVGLGVCQWAVHALDLGVDGLVDARFGVGVSVVARHGR